MQVADVGQREAEVPHMLQLMLEEEGGTFIIVDRKDVVYGQIEGKNRCRAPHLKPLRDSVLTERDLFQEQVSFICIDRTLNAEADSLANEAKEMSLAGVSGEILDTSRIADPS